jgi:ribose transport system permease protein
VTETVSRLLRTQSYLLAAMLAAVLLVVNIIVLPDAFALGTLSATLAGFAPFALLSMASAPSILSGRGGIDVSVAPLMGFVNILLVTKFDRGPWSSPILAVPVLLAVGVCVGLVNGVGVAKLRFPPVIMTLSMYFILTGTDLTLAPTPVNTPAGSWTADFAGSVYGVPGALLMILIPLIVWRVLSGTAYVRNLLAVGGNDAAAYSAGVQVVPVRILAYALGGLFAALAGLSLTGLVQTDDPNIFQPYVLSALAAVAIGGTSLLGGIGGMVGSIFGAACIFLLQDLLTSLHIQSTWLQVAYGIALIGAVFVTTVVARRRN